MWAGHLPRVALKANLVLLSPADLTGCNDCKLVPWKNKYSHSNCDNCLLYKICVSHIDSLALVSEIEWVQHSQKETESLQFSLGFHPRGK